MLKEYWISHLGFVMSLSLQHFNILIFIVYDVEELKKILMRNYMPSSTLMMMNVFCKYYFNLFY